MTAGVGFIIEGVNNEDVFYVLGGLNAFAAGVSKINELLGGGDDIVGAFTSSGCQIPGSSTTDSTFTIYDFDTETVEGCSALRGSPSPPPPLSVTILGDTDITAAGMYTWQAAAGGGSGGYTYEWQYCPLYQNCMVVGTSSSYSRQVSSGDPSFQLKVTVTAGSEQATDTHDVCVQIDGPGVC